MKGGEDSSASRQAFKGGWKCCYGVGELVRQISFTSPGPDDWEAFTCWVVTSAGMVEIAQEGMLTAMAEVGIAHSTLQDDTAQATLESLMCSIRTLILLARILPLLTCLFTMMPTAHRVTM